MGDAFRDAIMRALHQATHDQCEAPDLRDMPIDECDDDREGWIGDAHVAYDLTADTLLAMPEMDAIRQALDGMARSLAYECNDDVNHADADGRFTHPDRHSSLRECWLAEFMPDGMDHVIAWVVGHE